MNIDTYLAPHADALRLRSRRTALLATNIANADTPHYKARELAFAETLARAGGAGAIGTTPRLALSRSASGHVGATPPGGDARVLYRVPEGPSLDGNTVDKDQEQARFAENALRYQASLQFVKRRVDSLIRTLRGE